MIGLVARSNLRYWLQHRWQLFLMVTGLALGVAVVFAVDIANESAKRAFALSVDSVTGRTTHQLVAAADGLDESIYTRLRVELGVRNIAPVVEGTVVMAGETLQVLGVDLFAESLFRNATFSNGENNVREGVADRAGPENTAPTTAGSRIALRLLEPGAIILSESTAARFNLSIGDTLAIDATTAPVKLVNTITGQQEAAFESIVMMDIATAQDLLQMQGELSRIDLVLDDAANDASLLQRITSTFPSVNIIDAVSRNTSLKEMTSAFHTNLLAMSLLGVLVGAFLIYNTVTLAVLQRRSLFGVLRVTGVTRDELFRSVILESLFVASIGTAVGLLLGYLLGYLLLELVTRTINDLYFTLDVKRVDFGFGTIVKAIALGLGSALVAAIPPALEASRSSPVTVLQSSAIERRAGLAIPYIAVAGLVLIVVGMVITWISERSLWAGFAALMSIVLGYSLLIPLVLRLLTSNARRFFASGSTLTQYALRSLSTSISRTSVAIAALVIAVSATAGVGIMIGSFRLSVADWLGQTLQSDIYIRTETESGDGLPRAFITQLESLPDVADIRLARVAQLESREGPLRVLAVQINNEENSGFGFLKKMPESWALFKRGEGVFVSEPYAWKHQVELGDQIYLRSDSGERASTVSAIITDYGAGNGLIVMDLQHYQRQWADNQLTSVALQLSDSANIDATKNNIRQLADNYSVPLMLRSNIEIRERSLQIFDRTFAITHVLRILTIGVAFIGILSALLALALERASEFAVLRAVGLTPFELAKLVIVQCALMGLIAGVLALPLGYIMSKMLIDVINQRSFGWTMGFYVPPAILLQTMVLALIASVLAGWYPSRKLSRMSPAQALREN